MAHLGNSCRIRTPQKSTITVLLVGYTLPYGPSSRLVLLAPGRPDIRMTSEMSH